MRPQGKVLLIGLLVAVLLTAPALAGPPAGSDLSPSLSGVGIWQAFVWLFRARLPAGWVKTGSQLDPVGILCPDPGSHLTPVTVPLAPERTDRTGPQLGSRRLS